MDIQTENTKDQVNNNTKILKNCWNIKKFNNKDSSINSVIVPTSDNRQSNNDFPSLNEASKILNKRKNSKSNNKVAPPLFKRQSKKSLTGEIQILQINNIGINYRLSSKKDLKPSKSFIDNQDQKKNTPEKEDLNKALVPYSPYANYQNVFTPPPLSSLYKYWWKIPKCGFELINGKYSDDCKSQLKQLLNIINNKDESSNEEYSEDEYQHMINVLKTLNLKICDMNQSNYDSSLYANYHTISKIKIKDIPSPHNYVRRKSKLVRLESIIPNENKNNEITHLEDIFKAFGAIRVKNGPSSRYTVLMHLLFLLTPRELCLMTRVCKSWRKEILESKQSTELWWNIWMNTVWTGKAQKEKENYDKYLERSNFYKLIDISPAGSLASSLSSLSLNSLGSASSVDAINESKKANYPWYHSISRAERKRGTKVWYEKSVEEYKKSEIRSFEVISNSSGEEDSSSESDSEVYHRPEGRGKLTAEEKDESRAQYKLMGSKPKTKRPWTRDKGISKEWLMHKNWL